MSNKNDLISIINKFAESEWDVIDAPSKAWLNAQDSETEKKNLITAIKQADTECGSCGCEMDPLYKQALTLLSA